MTVRRNAQEAFDVDKADLAEQVREILREDPIYKDTTESEDGTLFTTNVKPNFLYQDTGMHVALERDDGAAFPRTVVDVTTVAQPFVAADVFGLYDRYINSFLAALGRRVEDPAAAPPRRYGPIRNRYYLRVLVLGSGSIAVVELP